MLRFDFCIPTAGKKVPAGAEWLHEIKYDGYRVRLERDVDRVRLITKGGYDWTKRYPRIVEAALKNRQKRFVIDGETIARGVDGYSDFNAATDRERTRKPRFDPLRFADQQGHTLVRTKMRDWLK